jgi:hypothetical protein
MAEQATDPEAEESPSTRLATALSSLETGLAQASRAVGDIQGVLPQIDRLAESVAEMEAAMNRARQHLDVSAAGATWAETPSPVLRPVPKQEAQAETSSPAEPPVNAETEPSEDEHTPTLPEAGEVVSRCLRLDVSIESGSLDLKAVDSSVSENPAVVDVALLDYDGRHATLKVWVEASADAQQVRTTLLESLERHLEGSKDAEVRVEFEQEASA